MNSDKLDKNIAMMKTFEDVKKMLDPYVLLAALSEDYRISRDYEPVNRIVAVINESERQCLVSILDNIVTHLNLIVKARETEDERPNLVTLAYKNKSTYIIKVGTIILEEFSTALTVEKINEMISNIPRYEKFVNKMFDQIDYLFCKFSREVQEAADKAVKQFNLPGFAVSSVLWDQHSRPCCRFLVKYYDNSATQVGRDLSYSLNLSNKDNCNKQLERIDQKVVAGFIQTILPKINNAS